MTDRRAVLDLDGVLVNNVEFEAAVTRFIVDELATKRSISRPKAEAVWLDELAATRSSRHWFKYDFHCERLGLGPIARRAHEFAISLLSTVSGAGETLVALRLNGYDIAVATDAEPWVAVFKLERAELPMPDVVWSSADAGATKSEVVFWRRAFAQDNQQRCTVVVDNRVQNLIAAEQASPTTTVVLFVSDEHVSRLPANFSPHLGEAVASDHHRVARSHVELRSVIALACG